MANINQTFLYGYDISWEEAYITEEEVDEGLYWDHPILKNIREFAHKHDLVFSIAGDRLFNRIQDVVVGIAFWQLDDISLSNIENLEKARVLFEERTQNGVLEELQKIMGRTSEDKPDLHVTVEER